jgi:hypothetical protein
MAKLPTIGLTVLRLYAVLFWIDKGFRRKIVDPTWIDLHGDCAFVVHSMLTAAPGWYAGFLHAVVVPNITAFSMMVEGGEAPRRDLSTARII